MWYNSIGDPGPRGSAQLTSQGMKGEKGNDGLPGPMGHKGEQGDTLIFSHITLLSNTLIFIRIYRIFWWARRTWTKRAERRDGTSRNERR